MDLYIIRRHGVWANQAELEKTTQASLHVGEQMKDRLRWIRSYVVTEEDGRMGSLCVYEASDPDAIREHGRRIGAPSDDFQVVRGTALKRDDPQPVTRV
ncbi:nickel-binding protein [Aquicoccus sp.]|uniref:nickel-binding protein n=1 Tax=Aquicoccus sp. TaxID=2055851 RepID=UPI0035646F1C